MKKNLLALYLLLTMPIVLGNKPVRQQEERTSHVYMTLPFVKTMTNNRSNIKEDLSPKQEEALLDIIQKLIEKKKNTELCPAILIVVYGASKRELAIEALTDQLKADLLHIEMVNIFYDLDSYDKKKHKRPESRMPFEFIDMVKDIFDHAKKYAQENNRKVVIWFEDQTRMLHNEFSCLDNYDRNFITTIIQNELKKLSVDSNITFVMDTHCESTLSDLKLFKEQTNLFNIQYITLPKIDKEGRLILLKRYFENLSIANTLNFDELLEETQHYDINELQKLAQESETVARKEDASLITEYHILKARKILNPRENIEIKEEPKQTKEDIIKILIRKHQLAEQERNDQEDIRQLKLQARGKTVITLAALCAGILVIYQLNYKKTNKENINHSKNKNTQNTTPPTLHEEGIIT